MRYDDVLSFGLNVSSSRRHRLLFIMSPECCPLGSGLVYAFVVLLEMESIVRYHRALGELCRKSPSGD